MNEKAAMKLKTLRPDTKVRQDTFQENAFSTMERMDKCIESMDPSWLKSQVLPVNRALKWHGPPKG